MLEVLSLYLKAEPLFCKCLRSPGIDSQESIQPAFVAWRACMSNAVVVPGRQAGNRFLGSNSGFVLEFYNNLWGLGNE
jgi:hypothetical protein